MVALSLACVFAGSGEARAQDLEPKAYSASPVGASFLVLGLSRSTGSILTDPTLPLKDVDAKLNGIPVAAGYTFGVFGKLALVTLAVPYAWGDVSGTVFEEARSVSRSGLTDARAKFSINLLGNPAVGLREFVKTPRKTMRRAFAVQRYWALYRTWKDTGDASLYEATSPLLSAAMEVEEGRVTRHVLPYDYLRLTSLVGTA